MDHSMDNPQGSAFSPSLQPRRIATEPSALQTPRRSLSVSSTTSWSGFMGHCKTPDESIETLYNHPSVKIIAFTSSQRPPPGGSPFVSDPQPGSLTPSSHLERTIAIGAFRIYRAPGSVAFLNCGSALQPILPKSQCWCIDEANSRFVLQIRRPQYWRIEVPVTDPEDAHRAVVLREVLDSILLFEKTECPFQRSFTVQLPERPQTPVKKVPWTAAGKNLISSAFSTDIFPPPPAAKITNERRPSRLVDINIMAPRDVTNAITHLCGHAPLLHANTEDAITAHGLPESMVTSDTTTAEGLTKDGTLVVISDESTTPAWKEQPTPGKSAPSQSLTNTSSVLTNAVRGEEAQSSHGAPQTTMSALVEHVDISPMHDFLVAPEETKPALEASSTQKAQTRHSLHLFNASQLTVNDDSTMDIEEVAIAPTSDLHIYAPRAHTGLHTSLGEENTMYQESNKMLSSGFGESYSLSTNRPCNETPTPSKASNAQAPRHIGIQDIVFNLSDEADADGPRSFEGAGSVGAVSLKKKRMSRILAGRSVTLPPGLSLVTSLPLTSAQPLAPANSLAAAPPAPPDMADDIAQETSPSDSMDSFHSVQSWHSPITPLPPSPPSSSPSPASFPYPHENIILPSKDLWGTSSPDITPITERTLMQSSAGATMRTIRTNSPASDVATDDEYTNQVLLQPSKATGSDASSEYPRLQQRARTTNLSIGRRALSPLPPAANLFSPTARQQPASRLAVVRRIPSAIIHKTVEILLSPPSHLVNLMLKVAAKIAAGEWRGLVFGLGEGGESIPVHWDYSDGELSSWEDEDDYNFSIGRLATARSQSSGPIDQLGALHAKTPELDTDDGRSWEVD